MWAHLVALELAFFIDIWKLDYLNITSARMFLCIAEHSYHTLSTRGNWLERELN